MKIFLLVLTIVAGSYLSCGKEEVPYKSTGTITGADFRTCPCCGGWFISIDSNVYNFDSLPPGSGIDLDHSTFPMQVSLDWTMDRNCGGIQYIIIQRIKKI
jgi:hypothetical protein